MLPYIHSHKHSHTLTLCQGHTLHVHEHSNELSKATGVGGRSMFLRRACVSARAVDSTLTKSSTEDNGIRRRVNGRCCCCRSMNGRCELASDDRLTNSQLLFLIFLLTAFPTDFLRSNCGKYQHCWHKNCREWAEVTNNWDKVHNNRINPQVWRGEGGTYLRLLRRKIWGSRRSERRCWWRNRWSRRSIRGWWRNDIRTSSPECLRLALKQSDVTVNDFVISGPLCFLQRWFRIKCGKVYICKT